MPPEIAPVQVVIVPIYNKKNADTVKKAASALKDVLAESGIRVELDTREGMRPGAKFFDWEIKGVPVRLELGGRDLENGTVAFARRDNGEKGAIDVGSVAPGVKLLLKAVASDMYAKAEQDRKAHVVEFDTLEGLESMPEGKILKFGWCGDEKCGHTFEDKYGLKILGTPYIPEEWAGKCAICGKEGAKPAYAARSL